MCFLLMPIELRSKCSVYTCRYHYRFNASMPLHACHASLKVRWELTVAPCLSSPSSSTSWCPLLLLSRFLHYV